MADRRVTHHPGSACCDPTQDLAGWIVRERARLDIQRRWARVLSQRGQRIRRLAISRQVRGWDPRIVAANDQQAHLCSARGMAIWQGYLVDVGHVDRVEQAHRWRLTEADRG